MLEHPSPPHRTAVDYPAGALIVVTLVADARTPNETMTSSSPLTVGYSNDISCLQRGHHRHWNNTGHHPGHNGNGGSVMVSAIGAVLGGLVAVLLLLVGWSALRRRGSLKPNNSDLNASTENVSLTDQDTRPGVGLHGAHRAWSGTYCA